MPGGTRFFSFPFCRLQRLIVWALGGMREEAEPCGANTGSVSSFTCFLFLSCCLRTHWCCKPRRREISVLERFAKIEDAAAAAEKWNARKASAWYMGGWGSKRARPKALLPKRKKGPLILLGSALNLPAWTEGQRYIRRLGFCISPSNTS